MSNRIDIQLAVNLGHLSLKVFLLEQVEEEDLEETSGLPGKQPLKQSWQ